MKKALRKGSATSDEDSFVRRDDDDTDTEHQDSLPHDEEPKEKRFGLSRLQQIRRTRKPSLVDIVQIAKQDRARSDSIAAANAALGGSGGSSSPGAGGAGGSGADHFPIKEPHPKTRFKVEKHEHKEKETFKEKKESFKNKLRESFRERREHKHKQSPPSETPKDAEHDPEANSRIVNERRASLLRRKKDKEEHSKPTTPESDPQPVESPKPDSHFELVDEKKPPEQEEPPLASPVKEGGALDGIGLGKFKFRRHKSKSHHVASKQEPDVFKFDDKSLFEKSKSGEIPQVPSSEHLSSELASGSGTASGADTLPLPSPTPSQSHNQRQMNGEKLAALSRQGRKKIGSLLALVREAVNLKKDDVEQGSDESPGPTTPTYLAYTPPPPPSSNSSATLLEMPPTPEPDSPTPSAPLQFGSSTSSAAARPTIKPPTPPVVIAVASTPTLATMDDLEELDLPGPITFPKRSASQRRRAMRQDSQSSIWSDNIPTITISTTGSDECIVEPEAAAAATAAVPVPPVNGLPGRSDSPGPTVNIIKINIEDNAEEK